MLYSNGRKRYLPPPPLSHSQQNLRASREDVHSNYANNAADRRLDDLHDWAIYRTNANSRYVGNGVSGGGLYKAQSMPFGEFNLDTRTVDYLHSSAKQSPHHGSALAINNDPKMYIEFGLPRLPTQQSRDRMSRAWSAANIGETGVHGADDGRRYGYSSNDVRDGDVDFSSKRQMSRSREAIIDEERDDAAFAAPPSARLARSNGSRYGIDNIAYSRDDVRDAPPGHWESSWDAADDIPPGSRPQRYNDDLVSAFNPNLKASDGYYKMSGSTMALATADHPANYKRPSAENERCFYEQQKNREYASREWKGYYSSMEELRANPYPHVQLASLSFDGTPIGGGSGARGKRARKKQRLLDNLSFEVHGGELLTLLGHRGSGRTTLLDILAGTTPSGAVTGRLTINGNALPDSVLQKHVAYVRRESYLVPYLSVQETIKFFLLFKKPEDSWFAGKISMIDQLIDEIRLAHVKDTKVSDLAAGEKKRLGIACQVALNTDIIILDEPTTDMETYPSVFLLEYLRGLARREKVVILSLHHPSMDVFSLVDKVVLLSSGRMMYYGSARGMISYFNSISYSYPSMVNPCDYYVDLVTMDDRSIETIAESCDRISRIANLYQERALPLSDPEPTAVGLRRIRHTGGCMQFMILLWRLFTCHKGALQDTWLSGLEIFLCALMSVLVGVIFSTRPDQPPLYTHERIAFMFVMLVIAPLPHVYRTIARVTVERREFYSEVLEGLYSPVAFFFAKIISDIPLAMVAALAYLAPAYWIAEMDKSGRVFGMYAAFMFLYVYGLRLMAVALSNVFRREATTAHVAYAIIAFLGASCGFVVHPRILWRAPALFWSAYVSNSRWAFRELVAGQLSANYSYDVCVDVTPTTDQPALIISEAPRYACSDVTGADELRYYGIDQDGVDAWVSFVVVAAFALFFFVFAFIVTSLFRTQPRRSRKAIDDPVNRTSFDYRSVFTL